MKKEYWKVALILSLVYLNFMPIAAQKVTVIDGNVTIIDSDNSGFIRQRFTTSDSELVFGYDAGYQCFIGSASNHDLRIRTSNANRMVVGQDGKIGIGIMEPIEKLQVHNGSVFVSEIQQDRSGVQLGESGVAVFGWEYDGAQKEMLLREYLGPQSNMIVVEENGNISIGGEDPRQNLEVNGGINLSIDFLNNPEAGTMRWNVITQTFEGFDGQTWKSFTSTPAPSPPQYAIGDFAHGGVVIFVDPSGEHGKVMMEYDIGDASWSNVTTYVNEFAKSHINGQQNSDQIVNQQGHINSAAKICLDLVHNGYDDWYLPAYNDFFTVSDNSTLLNNVMIEYGGEALSPTKTRFDDVPPNPQISYDYWTSTEDNVVGKARQYDVYGTAPGPKSKTTPGVIRAIRQF